MRFSSQYNIKILGVPQADKNESISICLKLFKQIGAKDDEKDMNIAHRTANRNQGILSPIIWNLVQQIANESAVSKERA